MVNGGLTNPPYELSFRNATRSDNRVSLNANLNENPAACDAAGQFCLIRESA
jgi:hypothetical protein